MASLELRVFSVTARQCVKVLSDSSYSLRWKSAFASESSCRETLRVRVDVGASARLRDLGSGHKVRWHRTCHSRLCNVSLFTLAPICAW